MGSWTIYSIGDAAFLEQIFIAVAMVTGTSDFTKAASIALLFAVLMYFFQSLMRNAQDFNLGQLLLGWIVFMCMFYPTTTVVIEDGVNGSVRVVANVPLGMGAVGGMTSSIGYGLTTIFEQAYGYIAPGITESHFADSLALLNKVRDAVKDPRVMQAINEALPAGADYRASWDNYIRECTLRKIDLGQETVDQLLSQPLPHALRFESDVYGTKLFLNGSSGSNVTCSAGFSELINAQHSVRGFYIEEALNDALNLKNSDFGMYTNAFTEVSNAFQALQLSQQDAYAYVEASILEPIYSDAVLGKYQDMQDFSSAVMINEALQQRNVQWASEQTLFMTTIRPIQTFFEGLVYALTPLIGVLVIMGSFGMSLAFKYFQTLLWIQFWLPILSIINLYIYTAASGELNSYNDERFASMYSLMGVNDVLQNWVGVGAMLAASTPVIALFLVTGSTYAMMGIAGRVSGADHVNEQMTTPDAVQSGAYMANQPKHTNSPMTGGLLTGAEAIIGKSSLGSVFQDSVSSSQEKHVQAQEVFSENLSRAMSSTSSQENALQTASGLGSALRSSHSAGVQHLEGLTNDFMKSRNINEGQRNTVMGALAMTAAAGAKGAIGANMGGTGGDVNANVGGSATAQKTTETSDNDMFSQVQSYVQGLRLTDTESADITDSVASSFDARSSNTFTHSLGDTASRNLQQAASQVTSAKEAYVETSQASQKFGASHDMKFNEIAGLMTGPNATPLGRQALGDLNEYFRSGQASPEVQQTAQRKENQYRNLGMQPAMAQTTARLEAMTDSTNYNNSSEQLKGIRSASNIIGQALGSQGNMNSTNPYQNQSIEAPNVDSEQLKGRVQEGVQPAAGLNVPTGQNTGGAYGSVEGAFAAGVGTMPMVEVINHNEHQTDTLRANAGNELQHRLATERGDLTGQMERNAPTPTEASKNFNGWSKLASAFTDKLYPTGEVAQFDPNNTTGLQDAMGGKMDSDYQFNKVAQLAKDQLGLPDDQAAYFAYRATGGDDPSVRESFINNSKNHITEREGNAIANNLEAVATVNPELAQGYLNNVHNFNNNMLQSEEVTAKTNVPAGENRSVDIWGTSPNFNDQPNINEADIRNEEANKQKMENYWKPDNQSSGRERFNESSENKPTRRSPPKRPDNI